QKGHETELVFSPMLFNDAYVTNPILGKIFAHIKYLAKKVVKSKPDLIAFSILYDNYHWASMIAREVNSISDIPIIFGGIHATSMPKAVISSSFADYVCVGEGEYALESLCISISDHENTNELKNIWLKKDREIISCNNLFPLIENLDDLPFPDKDLFYGNSPFFRSAYSIITSR
ncbi:cobalamin-dependent protein, partial [bacterium]|nr:cobalamin-dependent protein [bacterium]